MLELLQRGIKTTLQDGGRPGFRHVGIPASGAADKLSFALANWMVGNVWDAPALECAMGGQHFRFHKDTIIALAGAEMWAQINGQNVENFTAFPVKAGDILTLSMARAGCRTYLAVSGGFKDGETFLGSIATYLPAKLGGIEGQALSTGVTLGYNECEDKRQKIPKGYTPKLSRHAVLRARPGPEFDSLTRDSQRHLFISPFFATGATDRMGSRLKGNHIALETPKSMISSPILPGTLQVPPDGGTILSLSDAHCTGGYPRALQVIRADRWLLGQIAPGMAVSFQRCFADDAPIILKRKNAFYADLIDGFSF